LAEGAGSGRSIRTLGAKARKTSIVLSFGVVTQTSFAKGQMVLNARAWLALAVLAVVMGLLLFVPAATVHY
jgi:hypothetical protein